MNKDNFYVGVQLVIFTAYLLTPAAVVVGVGTYGAVLGGILAIVGLAIIAISVLQLNKNLSPFPTPKKEGQLITSGLYAIVRHPIYLGILVSFSGYAIYSGSVMRMVITILLGFLFHYKSTYEEELLTQKFEAYQIYQKKTKKIFPFV